MKVAETQLNQSQYYENKKAMSGLNPILYDELPESVRVSISEEGLKRHKESSLQLAKEQLEHDIEWQKRNEKFQAALKPATVLRKVYLTGGITQKLNESLSGISDDDRRTIYSIIDKDFLPKDIGNMTEDERKEKIYIGLEKEKYVSNYLDENRRKDFMEAITRIAQLGLNGTNDGKGRMSYDSRPTVWFDTPEYMSTSEMMKLIDSERYNQLELLYNEGMEEKNEEKMKAVDKMVANWERDMSSEQKKKLMELQEERRQWAEKLKNTSVESNFQSVYYDDELFKQSIIGQLKYMKPEEIQKNLDDFLSRISH